jgi:antitoxin component YwqK of YwqJK toxin-antitoxin module
MKIISFLCFIILFASCTNQKKVSPNKVLIEKRNGLIYRQGDTLPYTGLIKDTLNGKIMEYTVEDGLKSGEFKVFHLNGKLEFAGNMVKDKNEGMWQYFYPDGQLESTGNFKDDSASGKWIFYYRTGVKKEEGEYKNGQREGKWIKYDSTGKISQVKNFKNGREINEK